MLYLVVGLATFFSGLLGYSVIPPPDFGYRESDLRALLIFYMLATFAFLCRAFGYIAGVPLVYLNPFVGIVSIIAALYLLYSTVGRIRFSAVRFRNALVYGAILWLVGKELDHGYYDLLHSFQPAPCIIAGIVTFPVAFIIFYVVFNVRKLKTGFFPNGSEDVISCSYIVVYLIGLSVLGSYFESSVCCLSILMAALVVFYVLAKIYVMSRPFLE